MKITLVRLSAAAALWCSAAIPAYCFDFSDIDFWIGTGVNQAALVIDWNDGVAPDSLVWGYRWDDPAPGIELTMYDMVNAIRLADSRLQIAPHPNYNSPASGSYSIFSLYFDLSGQGQAPVVGIPQDAPGGMFAPPGELGSETGHATNPGDHYQEGWYARGFWGEYLGVGNPYAGGSWTSDYNAGDPSASVDGVAVDPLLNNSWYALSFAVNFAGSDPGSPTAATVPEPSSAILVAFGVLGLSWRRSRRQIC